MITYAQAKTEMLAQEEVNECADKLLELWTRAPMPLPLDYARERGELLNRLRIARNVMHRRAGTYRNRGYKG